MQLEVETPPSARSDTNTMKYENTKSIILALALGTPAAALAENSGDWCEWYGNKPGILYKNSDNPFLQEFQVEGRIQYQYGHVEGEDVNGTDYDEDYDEVRRARLGVKAKFLQYFGLKYQVNLVNDNRPSGGSLDWGYEDIDEAYVSFNLGKALGETGFDELNLIYGRQKFLFGTEAHASSTKLLTIERSALSNKVYGSFRPTGLTVEAVKGDWTVAGSIYSTTTDGVNNREFNGWNDTYSLLLNVAYQANDELLLRMDAVYNDADASKGEDSVMDYAWAVGFGAEYDAGNWGFLADVIYGDNGGTDLRVNALRRGGFYGFQVTPYYWLVEDKLQLVGQYQFEGADEAQGVRVNSRYGRRNVGPGININGGRGDSHQSFYGGLNYYICGHSAKIQAGIEYQTMNSGLTGDLEALTYLVGFRTYF
jgi:hypothetical protein